MSILTNLDSQLNYLAKAVKRNAPTILTVLSVSGFVTTTVMAVKATPKAMEVLEDVEKSIPEDTPKAKKILIKTKAVAPIYGPSALMGITSGYLAFKANNISGERLTSAITAVELRDKFINEYQNKVIEAVGEKKEQGIRDEVAKERVKNSIYEEDEVIQASTGSQLFMESVTGRYFRSTKDEVYQALLRFQKLLIAEDFMTHDDWCYELGLEPTKLGGHVGYNSTAGIDIYFSVQAAPNGEPCTVIEYRTPPTYDFCFNHSSDSYWN